MLKVFEMVDILAVDEVLVLLGFLVDEQNVELMMLDLSADF